MKINVKDGCIVVEMAKRYKHIFEERFTKLMNSSIICQLSHYIDVTELAYIYRMSFYIGLS